MSVQIRQKGRRMSLGEVYQLYAQIREHMGSLGHWQALTLALYSIGVVVAEKCIPGKVSEKCGVFGKPETVQRRLERWRGRCAAEHGVGGC